MAGQAIGLLLSLTTSDGVAPPDATGQTVLTKGPGGRSFTKRDWRALTALIAAEEAARQRAQESPEAEEALEPAISAAEGVIAAAPLIDDLPDDLGEVARALETAASASRLADITRLAEDAGLIARRVELEIYARIEAEEEAQDAADERLAFMLIDEEEKACARTIEKFLRKQQRRRRTV